MGNTMDRVGRGGDQPADRNAGQLRMEQLQQDIDDAQGIINELVSDWKKERLELDLRTTRIDRSISDLEYRLRELGRNSTVNAQEISELQLELRNEHARQTQVARDMRSRERSVMNQQQTLQRQISGMQGQAQGAGLQRVIDNAHNVVSQYNTSLGPFVDAEGNVDHVAVDRASHEVEGGLSDLGKQNGRLGGLMDVRKGIAEADPSSAKTKRLTLVDQQIKEAQEARGKAVASLERLGFSGQVNEKGRYVLTEATTHFAVAFARASKKASEAATAELARLSATGAKSQQGKNAEQAKNAEQVKQAKQAGQASSLGNNEVAVSNETRAREGSPLSVGQFREYTKETTEILQRLAIERDNRLVVGDISDFEKEMNRFAKRLEQVIDLRIALDEDFQNGEITKEQYIERRAQIELEFTLNRQGFLRAKEQLLMGELEKAVKDGANWSHKRDIWSDLNELRRDLVLSYVWNQRDRGGASHGC